MESGSQATVPTFTAESGDALWQTFTQSVPSCKGAAQGKTLDCLRQASITDLLTAASVAGGKNPGEFDFVPVIDGQGGVIPGLPSTFIGQGSFSKVPFIAGTNLDDGTEFTITTLNSDQSILGNLSSLITTLQSKGTPFESVQDLFVNMLVSSYPDDPTQGSPYNTGSNTFGLSPFFKKAASIVGDTSFQSTRRAWMSAAASRGVATYGYLFTEPTSKTYTGGE
jgi:acetylcholinesterase